jgi:hypothetical protein
MEFGTRLQKFESPVQHSRQIDKRFKELPLCRKIDAISTRLLV